MGRVLLIGAQSQIAKITANLLIQQGAEIFTVSREEETPLGSSKHFAVHFIEGEPLPEIEGPLDGLVYFPGTMELKPFLQTSMQQFEKEMKINFFGAVQVMQKYLPLLQHSQQASIVFISSIAAETGFSFHTSIAAAKGALQSFAYALATEFAPKVRVNVVAPSLLQTPLTKSITDRPGQKEASAKRHPLGRIGTAEDVAAAIVFLLSQESSWITGQVLPVDGGLSRLHLFL